jgi:hypothetical protein
MAGGKVYIESSNIASDYQDSELGEYLGINTLSSGNENEVAYLNGTPNSMASGLQLFYAGGESPHYSIDRISSAGAIILACEENYGRVSMFKNSTYNVAASSVVMGAIANGDSLNLKPYYVAELVYDLLDYNPSLAVAEITSDIQNLNIYPNPSQGLVSMDYFLQKQGRILINISDESGRLVRTAFDGFQNKGLHQIIWNGQNETGTMAKPGIYFYTIRSDNDLQSGKIILD